MYVWMALFLLIPFVFYSAIYEGSLLPKLAIFQIALSFLLVITLMTPSHPSLPRPIFLCITFYIFLHCLSIFSAINPLESTLQLAQHTSFLIIPTVVIATLSKDQLYRIINIAPWAGLPIALLGIGQYLGWEIVNIPSNAQPSATFFHRNAAAAYIICIFPLAWVGFQCACTPKKIFSQSTLLLILGIFLIFTRTRAAWVGLLGASLIVWLISVYKPSQKARPKNKFKPVLLCAICVIVGLAAWLPENIQGTRRVLFDEKKADAATAVTSIFTQEGHRGRLDLWHRTLSMIAHNPLGVGLGNWQFQYPYFARGSHINVKAAPERPHNDLLWIAAELGILGLFTFVCLIALTVHTALPLLTHSSPKKRAQIQGLLILLGAYLIDGLFSFPRGQIVPTLFFWFALGAITLLTHAPNAKHRYRYVSEKIISFALLVLCLTITYKRIQYDIYHQRVHSAERQENWNSVIQEANQALQIGTYRANTFIAQGRGYYRTGDFLAAETAYKIGLSLHPNSLNAYNNLGIVYRQLGKNELAIEAFQKALYLHPNFIEASYNLGNVYTNLARWDDAWMAYQMAQKNGLDIPQLYFKLGQVSYARGDLQQAQQYFLTTLQKDANFAPAIQALQQIQTLP